jgi:hypothetical protein
LEQKPSATVANAMRRRDDVDGRFVMLRNDGLTWLFEN